MPASSSSSSSSSCPSLCASYFPLLPSFQDLELPATQHAHVFAIDGAKFDAMESKQQQLQQKKKKPFTVTLLSLFLQNPDADYSNLGFENEYHGFTFIEVVYACLKASKVERQVIPNIDMLSHLLKALLHIAIQSIKGLQGNPTADLRKKNQNNLRVCIFYLCHGLCISEEALQPENKHAGRWLELKNAVITMLHQILESTMLIFNHQEAKIAGALIRMTAVSCLIHQRWGGGVALSKPSSTNLRKMLISILCHPFLYPLTMASDIAEETFKMLFSICDAHKNLTSFLVDMIAYMMSLEQSAGIYFLSRIISDIRKGFDMVQSGKANQMYDKTDLGLSIVAEFSLRKDALVIMGVYSAQLLPLLKADRAATRKYVIDIIGASLACYDNLSTEDQHALLNLYSFIMQDRDAMCRLKSLTHVGTLFRNSYLIDIESSNVFIHLVLKKISDKSKVVRLKALQVLESILLNMSEPSSCLTLGSEMEPVLITKVMMLLLVPVDSPYFCRDTAEASARLLCTDQLRESLMMEVEVLDTLLASEHGSARAPFISRLLHFHLNSYDQWLQFLSSRSEKCIKDLRRFLTINPDDTKEFFGKFKDVVHKAFDELHLLESKESMLLGALRLIALFLSPETVTIQTSNESISTITSIFVNYVGELCKPSTDGKEMKQCIITWILKIMVMMARTNKKMFTRERNQVPIENFISLYSEGIEGSVDFIFSLSNPYAITKSILQAYEEDIKVLESSQPLKLLRGYILFIGDMSKIYQFASDAFIRRLREARKQAPGCSANKSTLGDFDYMQQEEQKAQEEDAVLRFSSMLLDGNSVPGCYVPFLHELVHSNSMPKSLRLSAMQSLGRYMLTNINMAEKYKATVEALLCSEVPEIMHSSLELAESLIQAFPNEYSHVLTLVLSLLQNNAVKDAAAFSVYVRLILGKKFKVDVLLGPICDAVCGDSEIICGIAISLLKKLYWDAGKSKHKLVINLWKHCRGQEACKRLAQVLVEQVLEAADLQSDELASQTLQILALGETGVVFFLSFLHPSYKVLQTLDLHLSSCPPKVNLKGDTEAIQCLIQFVKNCKIPKGSVDKGVVAKILHQLQASSKKRKNQDPSCLKATQGAYTTLEDYEKAIESFRQVNVCPNMLDIVKHDI